MHHPFSYLLLLGVLSLIQLFPFKGLLLRTHLLGLFLFTTWHRIYNVEMEFEATLLYLLATTCILASYFFTRFRFETHTENPFNSKTKLDLRSTSIASFLLVFLSLPYFLKPGWSAIVLSIQFILALLIISRASQHFFLVSLAFILHLFLFFLLRESTQAGFEYVLVSFLCFFILKDLKVFRLTVILSLTILLLESIKPSFRRHADLNPEINFFNRIEVVSRIMLGQPAKNIFYTAGLQRESVFGEEPIIRKEAVLTDMRVRRTILPKQIEVDETFAKLLINNSKLLALPRGVINPLLIYPVQEEKKSQRFEKIFRAIGRVGDRSLENILKFTPHLIPYDGLERYKTSFLALIPRFLWNDKPNYNVWNTFGRRYFLLQKGDDKTSVSFTYISEAFMSYGYIGIIIISMGMGILLGLFDSRKKSILFTLVLASSIVLPFDLFTMFSKLLHRALPVLILELGIKRWKESRRGQKEKCWIEPELKNYHPQELEKAQIPH